MNCRDCGEPIQFLDGDKRPYDLTPRVHYANKIHQKVIRERAEAAGEKNGAKPKKGQVSRPPEQVAKSAKPSEAHELAVAGLMALKYKPTEAKAMLVDIPEGEPDDMIRAALKGEG